MMHVIYHYVPLSCGSRKQGIALDMYILTNFLKKITNKSVIFTHGNNRGH